MNRKCLHVCKVSFSQRAWSFSFLSLQLLNFRHSKLPLLASPAFIETALQGTNFYQYSFREDVCYPLQGHELSNSHSVLILAVLLISFALESPIAPVNMTITWDAEMDAKVSLYILFPRCTSLDRPKTGSGPWTARHFPLRRRRDNRPVSPLMHGINVDWVSIGISWYHMNYLSLAVRGLSQDEQGNSI